MAEYSKSLCVFMDLSRALVHKHANKKKTEIGQYSAILTQCLVSDQYIYIIAVKRLTEPLFENGVVQSYLG